MGMRTEQQTSGSSRKRSFYIGSYDGKLPVDSFGAAQVRVDKFGAVQILDPPCSIGSSISLTADTTITEQSKFQSIASTPAKSQSTSHPSVGRPDVQESLFVASSHSTPASSTAWAAEISPTTVPRQSEIPPCTTNRIVSPTVSGEPGCLPPRLSVTGRSQLLEPRYPAAVLSRRMEERQWLTQARPLPGPESMSANYVISPEDLIWASAKQYCGMVLDLESRAWLGTAVLFVAADPGQHASHYPRSGKSAWVTSLLSVGHRRQVLVRNSKGETHVADVLLTSGAVGLACLRVHTWQSTFGLAYLKLVTGPGSLPHRVFVDVYPDDRVYLLAYEPSGAAGTVAEVRSRPGIVLKTKLTCVQLDFAAGQLGGSIKKARGFLGGVIVRADGRWAGLVTLDDQEQDSICYFATAGNVYRLVEEL